VGFVEKNMSFEQIQIIDLVLGYSRNLPLNTKPWNFNIKLNSAPQFACIALLGPNGGGKTTLVKAILGENVILSGRINWQGLHSQAAVTPRELSQICSYLPQEQIFDPQMEVHTYLSLAWLPRLGLWKKPSLEMNEGLQKTSLDWGLEHLINKPLGDLSAGQRQRASIVRVLLQDTPFIIFDEPTSYLDMEGQDQFWKTLEQLSKQKTILLVSHEREKALKHCNTIFELE